MRLRVLLRVGMLGFVAACGDKSQDQPITGPLLQTAREQIPAEIAQAGCSVGSAVDNDHSQVLALSRSELPFSLPTLDRTETSANGRMTFYVRRIAIRLSEKELVLACIVPVRGNVAMELQKLVQRVPANAWTAIAERLQAQSIVAQAVTRTTGTQLRLATFPNARRAGIRVPASDTLVQFDTINAQHLPTVTVTAYLPPTTRTIACCTNAISVAD